MGAAITVPDLAAERARWPQFVAAALAVGYRSVAALPLRLGCVQNFFPIPPNRLGACSE